MKIYNLKKLIKNLNQLHLHPKLILYIPTPKVKMILLKSIMKSNYRKIKLSSNKLKVKTLLMINKVLILQMIKQLFLIRQKKRKS